MAIDETRGRKMAMRSSTAAVRWSRRRMGHSGGRVLIVPGVMLVLLYSSGHDRHEHRLTHVRCMMEHV